ncbi:MAG TPA: AraC family transcriptional regulator [Acidimicrobiales bacterium]|nr:AraC family transcriptional regulator [Acidimicrobiales bacterium]
MQTLFSRDGVQIADVACSHRRGVGQAEESIDRHALVFVRRGCFVRTADGVSRLLDPTLAYCMKPGQEQRYDHPQDHGDDCTTLFVEPGLLASLWGGDPTLPSEPIPTSPEIDLEHRLLLSASRDAEDPDQRHERAIRLIAATLGRSDSERAQAGQRPVTSRARHAAAEAVREMLTVRPESSLPELARAVAVSPHHLSRLFSEIHGHTISRQRIRVRVRAAMERLSGGEEDLARLAAELGFADQSHLCRAVRQETGSTPTALRRLLAG